MGKKYSNFKIFHFKSKLDDLLNKNISAPIHVRLKPTSKCGHRCFYCCYRNDKLFLSEMFNESDEIPWGKMKELIGDFKGMGIKAVTLSGGGEPLGYPHIVETVKALSGAGIKVAVLTNGSHLAGKVADILGHVASWVRVSMDAADARSYAKVRKVDKSEFDKVCGNIRRFSKTKNQSCELSINFIVSKSNYRNVYRFLELMKALGVDHVKISDCVISTKINENRKYFAPISRMVKSQIDKGISDLTDERFSIIDKYSSFEENDSYQKDYMQCPFMQCLTVVASDMNVYTCQDKAYTKSGLIGSIKNISFHELWYSQEAREKMLELDPSKECRHHCTQHDKNLELLEYMDINIPHLEFV